MSRCNEGAIGRNGRNSARHAAQLGACLLLVHDPWRVSDGRHQSELRGRRGLVRHGHRRGPGVGDVVPDLKGFIAATLAPDEVPGQNGSIKVAAVAS